jgi:hypothetical protein
MNTLISRQHLCMNPADVTRADNSYFDSIHLLLYLYT